MMKIWKCILFVSLFSLVYTGSYTADAQQNAGITLVPASIEEAANPGDTITKILTITNESIQDKEYYIYKRNIKGVEAGGVPIFAEENEQVTGYELSEWVEVPSEPVLVAANSSYNLPLSIRVPESATPGSHFGGIFVSVEAPKFRQVGAGVGYEVASIVSIRISGDILDSARIRSFSTDKLIYSSKKDVHFAAKVENMGNILIRPRGPVTITGMFGTKSETYIMNETLAGVFPGSVRDFEFTWGGEGLGFGKYEAIVALGYDGKDGQKTIDSTLVFWVFPVKVMLSILAGFLVVIGGGYFLTKYYINQAVIRSAGGRRITPQKYRRQVGVSRFTFVFIALLAVVVLFLLILLVSFA